MRNKHLAPIELTLLKHAILFSVYFLSAAFFCFLIHPQLAWAAAPTAPTNLTATVSSSWQINLSWQDNATNESNYYVERAPASTGSWTVIATLGANVTSYQNTGLTQNTTYYYRVRCKAGGNYSSYSNTANAMTATLAAPSGLAAAVISASSSNLAWMDNTAYESNYSIERSPNGSSSWTVIATLGANVTSYQDIGLTVGTAYYYRVRAYDGTNYSAYSSVVNQTIRTIAASSGTNGAIAPSGTVAVANGSAKSFAMTPNTGYKIATITVDGSSVSTDPTYTFTNVTANHTIAATFSAITYTITASAGANGTISPSGAVIVNSGAATAFTMTANSGYYLSNLSVDGSSVATASTFTFTNVSADHTIAATFSAITYTITSSAGVNGTISPLGAVSVISGATQTFTMTPNTGYYLSNLSVDGSSVATASTYTFTNVTANHTIAATFSAVTYTITASAGANGTISPLGVVSVISGATQTFTMTPTTGYRVFDVQVDGGSVGAVSSYVFSNVISNHTITAIFSAASTTINGGTISTNTTWTLAGSPYIVTGDVTVGSASSPILTIEAGVVVKFNNGTGLNIAGGWSVPGALNAIGTDGSPILFTSNDLAPAPGKWKGITFNNGTTTASLDHTTIEFGGSNGYGSLYINSGSPTIKNSTIWKGTNSGVYASNSYNAPTIQNSTIANNVTHGIYVYTSATPTIMGNTITNNGGYGIYDPTGTATSISGNTISGSGSYPARMGVLQTGNVNTYGTNGINAVEVIGGTIGQNLTMKNNGPPYIVTSDITAGSASNPMLTIEAGVVVKFNNGTGLNIAGGWSVPGALNAIGTDGSPILFTSNDPAPAPGKWKGITFNNGTTTASLDHTTIEFGGSNGNGNLYIYSGAPAITSSTIRNSSNYGINVASSYASPIIQNNTITNNGGYGIYDATGSATLISGNTISASGSYPARMSVLQTGNVNTYGTNGINAVEVIGGIVGQNLTMKNLSLPYIITNDITVGSSSNPMLTIEAGVTVKFSNGTGLNIANGTGSPGALKAVGTAALPIVFTSNDPAPAPGKWKGITFNPGTISMNTVLDFVTVRYGGYGGAYFSANLVINSSSPVIMNSTIKNSAGSGVYVTNASNSPVIVNSDISVNKWGVYSYSSNPFVQYNNIYANTTAGVWNATTSPDVDARSNWWGVATGPTYTAGNAGGSGDSINDHVLYNPWLGQATGSNLNISAASAMPTALNPNGGYITFTALLSSSATWTITISDGNNTAVNTFSGSGITIKQKWYGDNGQSIKVADGPYYYRIDAQDPISGAVASSPEGLLMVSSQVPIVYMDPLVDNQMFTGGTTTTINITGTVSDTADFKNYTLDYGVGENPGSWTILQTATTQVTDGLIYAWNTSALTGDVYTLRLTVNDNAGNTVVDSARVRFLWIKNMAVSQNYISPNGDGLMDTTTISATFSYPSAWTIMLNDSSGATVKMYSGTATTLSQNWDGTNDAAVIVADGIYSYQITAVSSETGVQATPKTGPTITVDTISPTALITAPISNSVLWNTVLITGSASDANIDTYKVEYGPSTGSGPWTLINSGTSSITNNTLATWNTSMPSQLPNGNYIIRLTVADKAGNTSISSVPVILDSLELANVGASINNIDTSASQSSSIFYTINSPATVSLKMIPEKLGPNGTPVYQASQVCSATGVYSFTWNGQGNTGNAVPDEAYIYILEATDGIKTTSYNPPAPTGTGTVTCSQSTGFDPAKNLPMTVTYTPALPSRVNINISWGGENFEILDAFPAIPGNHTFDWNGRNLSNRLLDIGAQSACSVASLLRPNFIIATGDTVQTSDFKTNPYLMSLSYGQLTRIQYTLSRDAIISVKITSPSGAIITLLSNQFQTAGPQELEWRGLDATDPNGTKMMIVEEGDYMVSVQAVNPVTGTSATSRRNLRIQY